MYEIEDGVRPEDIPEAPRGGKRKQRYPLSDMAIGQSFFVPIPEGRTVSQARGPIQAAVSRFYRQHPAHHFTIRYDAEQHGLRVFRLEDRDAD